MYKHLFIKKGIVCWTPFRFKISFLYCMLNTP